MAYNALMYFFKNLPLVKERGFHSSSAGKESICNAGDPGFDPWVGKIPWRKAWLPIPVFWPGEVHGLYSPGVAKSWT